MLAPDLEDLVISYLTSTGLAPAAQIQFEMPPRPTYPFFLVNDLSGGDDDVTEYPVVSIHCFASTRPAAATAGRELHTKMKALTPLLAIQISDGSYVSIDHLEVVERPHWEDYADDAISRYCGRYHIDLRVNQTT